MSALTQPAAPAYSFRRLGLALFPLGLGTAGFAGVNMVGARTYHAPGPARMEQLLDILAGIASRHQLRVMVDTSSQYGRSEELLGRCLEDNPQLRDKFFIATKWGLCFHPTDFGRADFSFENLRTSVERSARMLGNIDLLYLHTNPSVSLAMFATLLGQENGVVDEMRALKSSGRFGIGYLGVSISTVEKLDLVVQNPELLHGFDVIQVNANLLTGDPRRARTLRQTCLALVVNSPYRKGDALIRQLPDCARQLYQRAFASCSDAVLLTGTSDPLHLRDNVGHVGQWLANEPLTIEYSCEAAPENLAQEVERGARNYFARFRCRDEVPDFSARHPVSAQEIVRLLVGSHKTRLGAAPGVEEREILSRRVEKFVRTGVAIQVFLTWGPRKFFARGADNVADLADAVALERLYDIHMQIKELYPPGIQYSIFLEDFEGQYIENEPLAAFTGYCDSLRQLLTILDTDNTIRLVLTSELLEVTGRKQELADQLRENYAAIREYWLESEAMGLQNSERGAGYDKMAELGFVGPITRSTRDFYLGRLDRLLGDRVTAAKKRDMVIRLFACVLVHRQFDMFRIGEELPVKFSFLRIAGGPESLMHGRVDIRTVRAEITRRSLAPWSAKGYWRRKNGEMLPALKTWAEPLPAWAHLQSGALRLRRGDGDLHLRADLIGAVKAARDDPQGTEETAARLRRN